MSNLWMLIPLVLFILGLIWGFYLIFRKGDMVTQPGKMLGYFIGAILAFFIALLLTVVLFPAWADQMLGLATNSTSVQGLQTKTQGILQQTFGTPGPPAPTARPAPTSSLTTTTGTTSTLSGVPGTGQIVHTVAAGDTLSKLARQYGVNVADIQRLNNLADPNKLTPGQKLIIPARP
jgi:LysM repeat protein